MRYLIVVAHTDDECFGMGGSIDKFLEQGHDVFAMSLADGVSSRLGYSDKELDGRRSNAVSASQLLGFTWAEIGLLPDNSLDTIPLLEITQKIEAVISDLNPDVIFTHYPGDLNIDHQLVARATITACRPLSSSFVNEIMAFEVPSSTDFGEPFARTAFSPNHFESLSKKNIDAKVAAMRSYLDEVPKAPHPRSPRSIRALSKVRGSQAGSIYAEAFVLLRSLR